MATVQRAKEHAIENFVPLEELKRDIHDLRDEWLAEVTEVYEWLEQWLAAWNAHDLDTLVELVAEDLIWADPVMAGEYVHGRAEFREYIETFWRGFPDIQFGATGPPLIGRGPVGKRMAVSWRMNGTMTGPLAWWGKRYGDSPPTWAPTDHRAEIDGYDVYEFRNGQLAHYTIVADFLTLSQQLGLMPPTDGLATKLMLRLQHLTAPLARRQARRHG